MSLFCPPLKKNYELDASGSAFIYKVTTNNYYEKQTLYAVQIPLFIQFKTNINVGIDLNFRGGAKYFLPLNAGVRNWSAKQLFSNRKL